MIAAFHRLEQMGAATLGAEGITGNRDQRRLRIRAQFECAEKAGLHLPHMGRAGPIDARLLAFPGDEAHAVAYRTFLAPDAYLDYVRSRAASG